MLILAGILGFLAMLLLFADKYMDLSGINLTWPILFLLIVSVSLIGYYAYKNPQFLKEVQDFFASF
jgi:hypothetical protein